MQLHWIETFSKELLEVKYLGSPLDNCTGEEWTQIFRKRHQKIDISNIPPCFILWNLTKIAYPQLLDLQ